MKYTPKINEALKALYAEEGDFNDKAGVPLIFHAYEVASEFTEEDEIIIALLHDLIECRLQREKSIDDDTYIMTVLSVLFGEEIVDCLRILTHYKNETYFEYIDRISYHPLATKIKIADIKHNLRFDRLGIDMAFPEDYKRFKSLKERYMKALSILEKAQKNHK